MPFGEVSDGGCLASERAWVVSSCVKVVVPGTAGMQPHARGRDAVLVPVRVPVFDRLRWTWAWLSRRSSRRPAVMPAAPIQ